MIKVLHVTGGLDVGGVELGLLQLVKRLDPQEIHVTVYCLKPEDTLAADIRSHGAEVVFRPHTGNPWTTCRHLIHYLKEHPQDVVHAHNLFFSGWIMWAAARAGVPIRLAQSHSSGDKKKSPLLQPLYHKLMRALINHYSTGLLAVSDQAGKYLFGPGPVREDRVEIITSGIDFQAYAPSYKGPDLNTELGISKKCQVIGHVGNLRHQKNHTFLLDVAKAMLDQREDLHFVLVGEGQLRTELDQKCRTLNIDKNVTFTGTRLDVPQLMTSLFDLFLFPSLSEGMGQVLLQAQSAGLPILASNNLPREVSVVPQLLTWWDLNLGPSSWAEKALELLKIPVPDAAVANQQTAASMFSIDYTVKRLRAHYLVEVQK